MATSIYLSIDKQVTEPILRDYERNSGVHVRPVFVTADAEHDEVIQRIIAEKDSPHADVLWSDDPVRLRLLIERGLVHRYASRNALFVPCAFKSDDGSWTGTAAHASALVVNKDKVRSGEMPSSIRDLADPRWKGQIAISGPLRGTVGIHLAALASAWGTDAFREFLNQLKANGTRVTRSKGDVFRLVAAGEVAFGLTDTDGAAGSFHDRARIQVVYPDQDGMGAFLVPTAVVLLKGPHPEEGRRWSTFSFRAAASSISSTLRRSSHCART